MTVAVDNKLQNSIDEPQSSKENWQQDYSMTVRIYKIKTVKLYSKKCRRNHLDFIYMICRC